MIDVLVKGLVATDDVLDQNNRRRGKNPDTVRFFADQQIDRRDHFDVDTGLFPRFTHGRLDGILIRLAVAPGRKPHLQTQVPMKKRLSVGNDVGGCGEVALERNGPRASSTVSRCDAAENRMTSRIVVWPVSNITSRSMPTPSPPVGGMPCSRAKRKSSSKSFRFVIAGRLQTELFDESLALVDRVVQLGVGIADLETCDKGLESLDEPWIVRPPLRKR